MAPPLSTTDLKLARFRNDVLATYAESRGVNLTPEPVCGVCGGHPASEPEECDHPRCPSFPPAGDAEPVDLDEEG